MPYLGNQLEGNYTSFETQTITGDGSTSYTLSNAVTNGKELLVYINNVKQEEGSGKSYTASGTTITFSDAVASTDSCYVVYLGRTSQTVSPPDGSLASYTGNASISGDLTVTGDASFGSTLDIGTGSGTQPSYFHSFLNVQNNASTSNNASVTITSGSGGFAGLHFGDSDNGRIGQVAYNNSDDTLLLTANNSTRMTIESNGSATIEDGDLIIGTSGHGISFAATSDTAGMGSELLADYEEGTYDVTMTCGSSGTITVRSDYNTGGYIKVGNLVTVYGYVVVSAISSPNGYIQVNLPFAVTNTSEGHASSAIYVHIGSLSGKNTNEIGNGLAFNGQSYFRIYSTDSTAYGTSSANSLTSSSFMYFGGSYRTG